MNTPLAAPLPALGPLRRAPLQIAGAPTATPVRLAQFGAGILVAGALLWASSHYAANVSSRALQVLGRDCAPSIVAALRLRTAMSDLDANLVNEFLTAPDSPARDRARQAALRRRAELSTLLVEAASNITFGAAEKTPLIQLVGDLAQYEAEMSRALAMEEKGDHATAEIAARKAQNLIGSSLRRAAEALERTNREAFEIAYRDSQGTLQAAWAGVAVGLLGCTGALIAAQIFLCQRTRRLLNPGLLAASLILLSYSTTVIDRLSRASESLREIKEEAFPSIVLLWQTRLQANEANAAESRWLFDPAMAPGALRQFEECLQQILVRPLQADWPRVPAQLSAKGAIPQGYDGALIRALRKVSYPGEREALLETVTALARYAEIDGQMRALQSAGLREAAVTLCLSYAADGSNGTFERFEAALERALSVNQRAFDRALQDGLEASATVQPWCRLACPLLMATALLGLWLRWREYQR